MYWDPNRTKGSWGCEKWKTLFDNISWSLRLLSLVVPWTHCFIHFCQHLHYTQKTLGEVKKSQRVFINGVFMFGQLDKIPTLLIAEVRLRNRSIILCALSILVVRELNLSLLWHVFPYIHKSCAVPLSPCYEAFCTI